MYDASAKLASGILTGNIVQLGQTDQCLENVNGPFSTQHCLTSVVFHVWNFTEEVGISIFLECGRQLIPG